MKATSIKGISLEEIKTELQLSMVGMFSNAELVRATNGSLEMNNLTACCVVIKEK